MLQPLIFFSTTAQTSSGDNTMPNSTVQSKLQSEQAQRFLLCAPEISIFGICCVMVDELRGLERGFKCSQLTQSAFLDKCTAVLAQLTETARATERFGIILPVMAYGQFSPFFWRWFNWWDDYFQGLSSAEISEIETLARERMPEANNYRPEGDWVRYRHAPAFTISKN